MSVSCESNESISNIWHGECWLATIRRFSIQVVRLFSTKNGHEHVLKQGHEIANRTRWVCIQNERGRKQTAHERRTRILVLKNGLKENHTLTSTKQLFKTYKLHLFCAYNAKIPNCALFYYCVQFGYFAGNSNSIPNFVWISHKYNKKISNLN